MPSIDKQYLNKLKGAMHGYALVRRDVINKTGDALHHAKRAIFAIHRGNNDEAAGKLSEAAETMKGLSVQYKKEVQIRDEGSYRAALEEYVEASLFFQFVADGKIGKVEGFEIDPEVYVAGLCDVPGELQRYAIRAATLGDKEMVKKCAEMGTEIIGVLIEFNLTSYLRTKFDQAKQALHRLEQVVYEVSIRS